MLCFSPEAVCQGLAASSCSSPANRRNKPDLLEAVFHMEMARTSSPPLRRILSGFFRFISFSFCMQAVKNGRRAFADEREIWRHSQSVQSLNIRLDVSRSNGSVCNPFVRNASVYIM